MTTKEPFSIISMLPKDTPEYMLPAWLGAIHWAISEDDVLKAFREETGNTWMPGTSRMDMMVDESCGAYEQFFSDFIPWFNIYVWGPMK